MEAIKGYDLILAIILLTKPNPPNSIFILNIIPLLGWQCPIPLLTLVHVHPRGIEIVSRRHWAHYIWIYDTWSTLCSTSKLSLRFMRLGGTSAITTSMPTCFSWSESWTCTSGRESWRARRSWWRRSRNWRCWTASIPMRITRMISSFLRPTRSSRSSAISTPMISGSSSRSARSWAGSHMQSRSRGPLVASRSTRRFWSGSRVRFTVSSSG